MRKLDLSTYEWNLTKPDGSKEKVKYDVRDNITGVLLHPNQKMNGVGLLKHHKIASMINDCEEDTILLEDSDYFVIKAAFETLEGFGLPDVELVERVLNAPVVPKVKEG